ncbi:hypothetical protein [Cutibacterium acnes]|uniref:hypothetical protein n=1 Tax=Cutibacterium acnes TaxID=1747 RepID=UPI00254A5B3F|nr:hypothetical protein [Cutibacterium acnes]
MCFRSIYFPETYRSIRENPRFRTHFLTLNPESSRTFRKVRNASAQVIIQLSETMTGIEAVQAYYREPRNQEIFT